MDSVAALGSAVDEEVAATEEGDLLEKARRVWRKAWRAISARAGGNHSRVWRRMSDPLAGWRERAKHDIFCFVFELWMMYRSGRADPAELWNYSLQMVSTEESYFGSLRLGFVCRENEERGLTSGRY